MASLPALYCASRDAAASGPSGPDQAPGSAGEPDCCALLVMVFFFSRKEHNDRSKTQRHDAGPQSRIAFIAGFRTDGFVVIAAPVVAAAIGTGIGIGPVGRRAADLHYREGR